MLTLPPDPYLALQVERDAGLPEIRTAYRKLILKCHPDKVQDPLQKQLKQDEFQKVQSAYELLSSEVEKTRYDQMYKLNQLEREKARMETSAPRSSRRERESEYHHGIKVQYAEPRASTYTNSPFPSPSKAYAAGTPPSRSYEEVYTTYESPHPPRKTASYESARGYKSDWEKRDDKYERRSKKDDKKDREDKTRKEEKEKRKEAERKEREKEDRREEKRREKEKAERKEKEKEKEKEERRREKEKDKKKAEQARKKDADLKAAQAKVYASQKFAAAYSSSSEDDGPKVTRRTSGTQEPVTGTSERERKYSATIEVAAEYLARSGANVSINSNRPKPPATEQFARQHANIIPMAAPTPPIANSPFGPPPVADIYEEEEPHRSSAKSSSRRPDKSYKKPSARGSSRDPGSVEYTHRPPPLQHSATMPIRSRQSETSYISRPAPALNRAQTFQESSPRYPRERSRSRNRRYHSDDEDSDGGRHARRSHSHRSPERAERGSTKIRYAVDSGKTSTRQISSEDISRHHKSSKSGYPTANTGVRMDPEYSHYSTATPGKIRYAQTFDEGEVKYANYATVREEPIYTF